MTKEQLKFKSSCMAIWTEDKPKWDASKMVYLCFQREIAPETKNLHWQTYVEFKDKGYAIKYCQKYLGAPNCHIESRIGNPYNARAYCCGNKAWEDVKAGRTEGYNLEKVKDKTGFFIENSFEEFGSLENCPLTKKKKGQRTDLENLAKKIDEGKSFNEMETIDIIKYSKGIKEAIAIRDQKKNNKWIEPEVTVLWGPAGSHKTSRVMEKEGYENVYKLDKTNTEVWFDGYQGQKVLLIDDFYGWIPWGHLLNILDGYPLRLQIKGCHTWKAWEKVYITSNKTYEEWYNKNEEHLEPLTRRIKYTVFVPRTKDKILRKPVELTVEEFDNKKEIK